MGSESHQGDNCKHRALSYMPRMKIHGSCCRVQCQAASRVGDKLVEIKSTQSRPRETTGSRIQYVQDMDTTSSTIHTAVNATEQEQLICVHTSASFWRQTIHRGITSGFGKFRAPMFVRLETREKRCTGSPNRDRRQHFRASQICARGPSCILEPCSMSVPWSSDS